MFASIKFQGRRFKLMLSLRIKFRQILCFLLFSFFTNSSLSSENEQISPSPAHLLPKDYGYLLIELDAQGIAPSFEYRRLHSNDTIQSTKVELKSISDKFLLLPLKKGQYQITRVNAPFFKLPFYKSTENEKRWSFAISDNFTNYFGLLLIQKERSRDYVHIDRLNRIASTMGEIEDTFRETLALYPLRLSLGYEDPYLRHIKSNISEE